MLGIPGTLIPPSLLPSNLCPTLSSPSLFHPLLRSPSYFHRYILFLSFSLFFNLSFFFFVRSTSIIFLSRRLFAREITFLCPDHCPLHLCFFVQQSFSLSLSLYSSTGRKYFSRRLFPPVLNLLPSESRRVARIRRPLLLSSSVDFPFFLPTYSILCDTGE